MPPQLLRLPSVLFSSGPIAFTFQRELHGAAAILASRLEGLSPFSFVEVGSNGSASG